MNRQNEILSLTGLRGVVSVYVALFHFAPILYDLLPECLPLQPLISTRRLAVPLFFILSGYTLSLRYRHKLQSLMFCDAARFWWLRFGRLYPVHLVTLMIALGIAARHEWPTDEGHSFSKFVENLTLTHAWAYDFNFSWNYPSWSISSEVFAYFLFPLMAAVLCRVSRKFCAAMLLLACALAVAVYSIDHELPFSRLLVVLPTFAGGAMLAVVCPPGALTGWRRYGSEGLLAIYLFIPFVVEHNAFRNALFIVLFFALVAAFSASGSGASAFWRSRPLIFLGEISYSLYLTHTLTMTLETRFLALDGIRGESLWIRMGVILAMVLFVFVVAVLMYYSVEWPARLLSRRLADSSTARPILGGPLVSTVTVSS